MSGQSSERTDSGNSGRGSKRGSIDDDCEKCNGSGQVWDRGWHICECFEVVES